MTRTAVIPDLTGRTYLVTGANTGIGRVTAERLADHGARVWLACRSEDKTRPVIESIQSRRGARAATFLALDLGDLASVRAAADRFLESGEPLHGLVNNAGLAGARGLTRDGFEIAFGTNHLGHYLFTELLLERLKSAAPSRVVIVASKAHFDAKGIDWDALRQPTRSLAGLPEYAVSKLCNVLHARSLAQRLAGTGVTTYALHPGVVGTDVWREVPWPVRGLITRFMLTTEQGAQTNLHCATSPGIATDSGRYYDDCTEFRPSRLAQDDALMAELEKRSAAWVA